MLWRIGFTRRTDRMCHGGRVKKIFVSFTRSLSYFEDRKVLKGIDKLRTVHAQPGPFYPATCCALLRAYYVAQAIHRVG